MRIFPVAVVFLSVVYTVAHAGDPTATSRSDGKLVVEGIQPLSNSCLSLGQKKAGAPERTVDLSNAQPLTLEIRHSGGDMCAMVYREVSYRIEVIDMPDRPMVVLYRTYPGFPESLAEVPFVSNGLIIGKTRAGD
jgi:hypothetical protein